MNPEKVFCPKLSCAARGKVDGGNIHVHSEAEGRYRCDVCHETFTTSYGTIFYRLRTAPDVVMLVLVLLANGCPIPAIVAAYGFDAPSGPPTIKSWWKRAGVHCEAVHTHVIGQSKLDLVQVQADEIRVKVWGGVVWMALAIMVPTRLWIGGVISPRRDKALIQHLADQIRACALCRPLLLAVDGLASYPGAFKRAFRSALPRRRGRPGRPTLVEWPDIVIVQVVKHRTRHTFEICRRIVQGTQRLVDRLLCVSQGGGVINTAFIERLNATFRQRLAWLTRRSRCLAHQPELLHTSMFIVGTVYNFCDFHHALRLPLWLTETKVHWVHRTPAMAAGLTDHPWSFAELFGFRVPRRLGLPQSAAADLLNRLWNSLNGGVLDSTVNCPYTAARAARAGQQRAKVPVVLGGAALPTRWFLLRLALSSCALSLTCQNGWQKLVILGRKGAQLMRIDQPTGTESRQLGEIGLAATRCDQLQQRRWGGGGIPDVMHSARWDDHNPPTCPDEGGIAHRKGYCASKHINRCPCQWAAMLRKCGDRVNSMSPKAPLLACAVVLIVAVRPKRKRLSSVRSDGGSSKVIMIGPY